uniref:diguanylate cyclase n=1 Tax=Chlorobium chlorochromatii (strain CaD3) TaxID=340177 RepID=Q3AS41_CHLCH
MTLFLQRLTNAVKHISPLQALAVAGVVGMALVVAGSVFFVTTQHRLLREMEHRQALYLALVEFRSTLLACEHSIGDESLPSHCTPTALQQLLPLMRAAHAEALPHLQQLALSKRTFTKKEIATLKTELERAIPLAQQKAAQASVDLLGVNQRFMLALVLLLLLLGLTAGLVLRHNYRQTIIPLAQLVAQLKLLNRNIPESIRDTAAEMSRELRGTAAHSHDITQITESVIRLCGDIEAKNRKLDELYIRDEKTQLFNYRHFKEHLILDIERAKRQLDSLSLAMLDIDFFKQYNDANGHLSGDKALKRFAELISAECRVYDLPARFGGDEFALLFPRTSAADAADIAERLRHLIESASFPHAECFPDGKLTISIGLATFPNDAQDWHSLLNNADRALYKAKALGRNSVVSFSEVKQGIA